MEGSEGCGARGARVFRSVPSQGSLGLLVAESLAPRALRGFEGSLRSRQRGTRAYSFFLALLSLMNSICARPTP